MDRRARGVRSSTGRTSTCDGYTVCPCSSRTQSTGRGDSSIRSNTDRSRTSHSQACYRTHDRRETDSTSEVERTGQRDRYRGAGSTGVEVDGTTNADSEVADVRDESCTVSMPTTRTSNRNQVCSRSRRRRSTRTGNSARDHRKTGRTVSGKTSRRRDNSGKTNSTGKPSRGSYGNRRAASRTRVEISRRRSRDRKVSTNSKGEHGRGRVRSSTRRTSTSNSHRERASSRRSTGQRGSACSIGSKRHRSNSERVTGQTSRKRSIRENDRTDKVERTSKSNRRRDRRARNTTWRRGTDRKITNMNSRSSRMSLTTASTSDRDTIGSRRGG